MGTENNPAIANGQSANELTSAENEVSGERLRLNKQTLQDLSPTDDVADKVRGGRRQQDTDGKTCSCNGGCF